MRAVLEWPIRPDAEDVPARLAAYALARDDADQRTVPEHEATEQAHRELRMRRAAIGAGDRPLAGADLVAEKWQSHGAPRHLSEYLNGTLSFRFQSNGGKVRSQYVAA